MTKISATIVADSLSPQGERLTSLLVTFPRPILAELNTHRMLSKNSASSRAIPFNKMVEAVKTNPFIPIAWQKDHKGMQGSEYFTGTCKNQWLDIDRAFGYDQYENMPAVDYLEKQWLQARDAAVDYAITLNELKTTKQLVNRLLEPFMWHTVIVTATEWENFFALRCPKYVSLDNSEYRSWKDLLKDKKNAGAPQDWIDTAKNYDTLAILKCNKGQAEIHMMALAEAIYDSMNESTPRQLQPGEWHIPFENRIDNDKVEDMLRGPYRASFIRHDGDVEQAKVEISTAMAARTSYTIVGDEKEVNYEKLLSIHDKMANAVPFHASPFEHCARAMSDEEFYSYVKGNTLEYVEGNRVFSESSFGWCRNFRGFIQYRELLENKI